MSISEWSDKYNSFNSYKGLMYKQWYDSILQDKFIAPIECSVDPVNACQLDCIWCNGQDVKNRNVFMDGKHLIELIEYFRVWGVKGVCFAGGGEPTLHPELAQAFWKCQREQLPCAIITNGLLQDNQFSAISECARWIGISVDSASQETYKLLKGQDMFVSVISNISKLVQMKTREVTYKFLLHPKNQHEVFAACEIAHMLGCHRIHIRPLSFRNYQESEETYDIDNINKQVDRARKYFESEQFRIFYIQHKYNEKLHVKFGFRKCRATPIMPIFHANGDMSICIDRKNDGSLVFGRHDPIEGIIASWGSKKHKDVINSVDINKCPKCTINYANEQMEQAVLYNKMDWEFV